MKTLVSKTIRTARAPSKAPKILIGDPLRKARKSQSADEAEAEADPKEGEGGEAAESDKLEEHPLPAKFVGRLLAAALDSLAKEVSTISSNGVHIVASPKLASNLKAMIHKNYIVHK